MIYVTHLFLLLTHFEISMIKKANWIDVCEFKPNYRLISLFHVEFNLSCFVPCFKFKPGEATFRVHCKLKLTKCCFDNLQAKNTCIFNITISSNFTILYYFSTYMVCTFKNSSFEKINVRFRSIAHEIYSFLPGRKIGELMVNSWKLL